MNINWSILTNEIYKTKLQQTNLYPTTNKHLKLLLNNILTWSSLDHRQLC